MRMKETADVELVDRMLEITLPLRKFKIGF
jgi:hypothetical protein